MSDATGAALRYLAAKMLLLLRISRACLAGVAQGRKSRDEEDDVVEFDGCLIMMFPSAHARDSCSLCHLRISLSNLIIESHSRISLHKRLYPATREPR